MTDREGFGYICIVYRLHLNLIFQVAVYGGTNGQLRGMDEIIKLLQIQHGSLSTAGGG